MDIAYLLSQKLPGKEWTLNGDDYENLQFKNEAEKPSLEQLKAWEIDVKLADKISEVKQIANEKILARLPIYKQNNLAARGLELLEKLINRETLTEAELAERAQMKAAWDWVKAVRRYSEQLEAILKENVEVNIVLGWPEIAPL